MKIKSKDLALCLHNFKRSMKLIINSVPPFDGMLYESLGWVIPETKRILSLIADGELSEEVFNDIYESLEMFDGFYEACEVSPDQLGIPSDIKLVPLPLLRKVLTCGITELDKREITMKETIGYTEFEWEV